MHHLRRSAGEGGGGRSPKLRLLEYGVGVPGYEVREEKKGGELEALIGVDKAREFTGHGPAFWQTLSPKRSAPPSRLSCYITRPILGLLGLLLIYK